MADLRYVPIPRLPSGVITGEQLQPYLELLVREVLSKADIRAAEGVGITITADGNVVATLDATQAITDAVDAHEAAVDPHTQYLTQTEGDALYLTQAEGDALYEPDLGVPGVDGHVLTSTIAGVRSWAAAGGVTPKRSIGMVFDGGGSTPTPGSVGYVVCPCSGVIDRWDIVADQSGSAVVDVWKVAGAIPTDANRIAGTEKLTLSAQQLASDTSLSSWTTAVTAGDVFGFELESVTTCTRITAEVRIVEA